jgi:hypothetical protein
MGCSYYERDDKQRNFLKIFRYLYFILTQSAKSIFNGTACSLSSAKAEDLNLWTPSQNDVHTLSH